MLSTNYANCIDTHCLPRKRDRRLFLPESTSLAHRQLSLSFLVVWTIGTVKYHVKAIPGYPYIVRAGTGKEEYSGGIFFLQHTKSTSSSTNALIFEKVTTG